MSCAPIIRTSDPQWFIKLKAAFDSRSAGRFINDAGLPIRDDRFDLRHLGEVARSQIQSDAALATVGLGIVYAILAVLAGMGVYEWFTGHRPPNVKIKIPGVDIEWSFPAE